MQLLSAAAARPGLCYGACEPLAKLNCRDEQMHLLVIQSKGAGGHLPLLHVTQIGFNGILQSAYELACKVLVSCTSMTQLLFPDVHGCQTRMR